MSDKKVIIAGFANVVLKNMDDTSENSLKQAGFEIWTMNDWWDFLPWLRNPDRVFQIHCDANGGWEFPDIWDGKRIGRGWRSMYNESGAKIVTIIDDSELENQVFFPKEYFTKYGISYFTSTVNYMMAMAVEEGFGTISIQDCAMFGIDEYKYQLPALIYAIRLARERGISVMCPFETVWKHAGIDFEKAVPAPRKLPYGMQKDVYNLGEING